jgi:hypothetical protein
MAEEGADMLLVQWGIDGGQPFVDFTRQMMPPARPGHDDEVWVLSLQYRYAAADAPPGFKAQAKWFRSLHDEEKYNRTVFASPVIEYFNKLKRTNVLLTFHNVE